MGLLGEGRTCVTIQPIACSFLYSQFVDDGLGETRIGFQRLAHVFESRAVGVGIDRYGAVLRDYYVEVAHIGIGSSEEDAVVACYTGEDESLYFEMAK